MATKNNAKLLDIDTIIAAGFDPKTGLPYRLVNSNKLQDLKPNIKKTLRIVDE